MAVTYTTEQLERVDELIKRNDIRFIRLQFSDIMGVAKHVTIPISHWDDAIEHGVWFDGSSVEGFARIAESDMYLGPDLNTFAVVPWDMDLSTARVICDVYTPDGDPFAGDPRNILKRQLQRAADMGFTYEVGPELEFFLFKRHADGSLMLAPTKRTMYADKWSMPCRRWASASRLRTMKWRWARMRSTLAMGRRLPQPIMR